MTHRSDGSKSRRRVGTADGRVVTDGAGPSLFESTPRPVIEYTSGSDGPVVRRVNPAFDDTFGVDGEIAAQPLATILASIAETDTEPEATVLERARRGESCNLSIECDARDGTRDFRVETVPAGGGGYVFFSDGDAAADSRERLDVIDFLAHSIRNPVEVATIHAEVTRDAGELEHLDEVLAALDRIERIVEDATMLSRQGEVVSDETPTDVGTVARDAWRTVRTGAATLHIGDPGTIVADESRLRELFENLFRNAVTHGSPDGRSESGPGGDPGVRVAVDATADGFAVSDDGVGIPEEERDVVLDAGYTTTEEGTGLGLAIVSEIAKGHGWGVDVLESERGGARFEFTGVERAGN